MGVSAKDQSNWLLIIAYTTITFPVLTVFLLWRLKFIESMQMTGLKERYGPLIASMLFYFWIFWIFHKQFAAPMLLQSFLLGVFMTTVLTFLQTIFFKVSLHAAGWGSVAAFGIICMFYHIPYAIFLSIGAILLAGLVGTTRLYLQAHTHRQIYIGYLVGILAQVISLAIIKIAFY